MAKGKNPALSPGRYVSKDPEDSIAVWNARALLIGAIKRVLPEFLNELANEVFPLYANKGELSYESWYERWEKAFNEWAAKFNFDSDWQKHQSFCTLEGWRTDPIALANQKWSHPVYSRTVVITPEFQCDGWAMELEPWTEYEKRVRSKFEEFLSETKNSAPDLAVAKGLVPTQRQYSPQNLDWFILYQFGGMSYVKIVEHLGKNIRQVDASGVQKGVEAAAKLLAIKLRARGPKAAIQTPPKPTRAALRKAVQAALNPNDTGAYIAAANALDVYEAKRRKRKTR